MMATSLLDGGGSGRQRCRRRPAGRIDAADGVLPDGIDDAVVGELLEGLTMLMAGCRTGSTAKTTSCRTAGMMAWQLTMAGVVA